RVDRHERAAVLSEEDEAAGGGQRAAPGLRGPGLRDLPGDGARLDVDRAEDLLGRLVRRLRRPTVMGLAGLPLGGSLRVEGALLERLDVVEARGRVKRRGEPVGGAFHRRTDPSAFRRRLLAGVEDRTAVRSDLAGPGQLL